MLTSEKKNRFDEQLVVVQAEGVTLLGFQQFLELAISRRKLCRVDGPGTVRGLLDLNSGRRYLTDWMGGLGTTRGLATSASGARGKPIASLDNTA